MDPRQLAAALVEAGVDGVTYAIRGEALGGRLIEGGAVLDLDPDGRWFVGGWERGQLSVEHRFATEDEACRYLYRVLAGPSPVVRARNAT